MWVMPRRWTQRFSQSALALLVALTVAAPAQALLWCNSMQRAMTKPCCAQKAHAASPTPMVARRPCCEVRAPDAVRPATMPSTTEFKAPVSTFAALTTVPPPALAVLQPSLTARSRAHRAGARAGPQRALHDQHISYVI
jgi:hypothetical protein